MIYEKFYGKVSIGIYSFTFLFILFLFDHKFIFLEN